MRYWFNLCVFVLKKIVYYLILIKILKNWFVFVKRTAFNEFLWVYITFFHNLFNKLISEIKNKFLIIIRLFKITNLLFKKS